MTQRRTLKLSRNTLILQMTEMHRFCNHRQNRKCNRYAATDTNAETKLLA